MILSQTALVLIGLVLAAWSVGGVWIALSARARARRAEAGQRNARRLARMVDESPALPLLVRADGRIEGPQRVAGWFGLDAVPEYLSELDAGKAGLDERQLSRLSDGVRRAQKTGEPFRIELTPRGGSRSLAAHGHLADPQVSPGGAALVWLFDFSASADELAKLRAAVTAARADFAGLSGLIEAAPLPMWFRGPDMALRIVNTAYCAAVGAPDAATVIAKGIELVEPVDGLSAGHIAAQARKRGLPNERTLTATIAGQRKTLRVTDLPLGDASENGGVAGYAVDIEDMEELNRQFSRFRDAQRKMLDSLSAGIAQFDGKRNLSFTNQPFLRLFALQPTTLSDQPPFDRVLDRMREAARLPDVRDFPEWRRERQGWFLASEPREEAWSLSDGTHLRVVAQPMPDGGLLLIFEDRTEQLQLSATRDTLLRTRTATFDNMAEALAVFAPDGRVQLWNRKFAAMWGLEDGFLDTHPRADVLLRKVAPALKRPAQVGALGQVIQAATLERKRQSGRMVLADGRTLEFAGVPLPDGNGMLTVLDITDSQKVETALRERNAALVEADAFKTGFLASVSYEFRNPLTSIQGFAEMLQAGVAGELPEKAHEYIRAILTSVGRLGEQIENVLDLTQSEAGTLPLAREPVELFPLMTEVVKERADKLTAAGLTLDLRGNKSVGETMGDPRRLKRAFGQLLENAIAATPPGGRILVDCSRKKAGAQIVISDNGKGMDAAMLARALEGLKPTPGTPSNDWRAPERRSGLGLPLVRQLIDAHGGKLELMSEPGEGTSAIVTLP